MGSEEICIIVGLGVPDVLLGSPSESVAVGINVTLAVKVGAQVGMDVPVLSSSGYQVGDSIELNGVGASEEKIEA